MIIKNCDCILVHLVWGTKHRKRLLKGLVKQALIKHIKENAIKKNILIHALNGGEDHLHCIFKLPHDKTIAKVAQLLKGESAFWANQSKLFPSRFEWAVDYYVSIIPPDAFERVLAYVNHQEEHHQRSSYTKAVSEILKMLTKKVEESDLENK